MERIIAHRAVIVLCDDGIDTYTWVAHELEDAERFVRENLIEVYFYDSIITSKEMPIFGGTWATFDTPIMGKVKYKLDRFEMV